MWAKQKGFTIVELLIVIVVIGILAAITIVAYSNIQDRANDTAVKNDLASIAKKFRLYQAEYGTLPLTTNVPTLELKASKSAYTTDESRTKLLLCMNADNFAIAGRSKSGTVFTYYSTTGPGIYGGSWLTQGVSLCSDFISGLAESRFYGHQPSSWGTPGWDSRIGG